MRLSKNVFRNTDFPLSKNKLPVAMAVYSDQKTITILCPFCDKLHHHGHILGSRAPHCTSLMSYESEYEIVVMDRFEYDKYNDIFFHTPFKKFKKVENTRKAKSYLYRIYRQMPDLFIENDEIYQRKYDNALEEAFSHE